MNFILQCNRFRPTRQMYKLKLKVYSEGEMEEEILGEGGRPDIQAFSLRLPVCKGKKTHYHLTAASWFIKVRVQTSSQ